MRHDLKVEFRPGAAPLQQDVLGSLSLPGESGSYASTPHVAALGITEALDVRIDMTHPRWSGDRLRATTDHHDYANVVLAGKYEFNTERSWVFYLTSAGSPAFLYSGDGVNDLTTEAGRLPYVRAGGRRTLRVAYEADVGGFKRIQLWQGPSIDGPWVLLRDLVEAGALSLFNATGADLEIGSYNNGGPNFPFTFLPQEMEIHRFQVRDGVDGTIVADADFSGHTEGATNFTDDAGLSWTINGDAHVSADVPVPAWVDISDEVLLADWRIGRERDSEDWPPGEGTVTLKNEHRDFDPDNSAGPYFGLLEPRTPFRFSAPETGISALHLPPGQTYLDVPNVAGNNITTPASSSIALDDGFDLRIRARLADWQNTAQVLVARAAGLTDGDFSWRWRLNSVGLPIFEFSPNGSDIETYPAGQWLTLAAGSEAWLRVTLRADDGFGSNEVRHWVSFDGDDWMELPFPVSEPGAGRVWGGSRPLSIGPQTSTEILDGEILQFQMLDPTGRVVVDADFSTLPAATGSFTDDTGNDWTLNGTTSIATDSSIRSWVSTPDHNDFDLAGNMDIRFEASLEDWRPGYDTVLASKWDETGNQRSWILGLTGDGHLIGVHSTTGADEIRHVSTAPVTPGPGGKLAVRAFFVPNFLGSSLWQFFTSTDGVDGTFTQLGATVTIDTSPTTLFASTATPEIGTFNQGSPDDPYRQLTGYVHRLRVTDGITVTDVDFTADHAGDPSVTGSTGKVWTLQGDAELVEDPASVGDQFYGFVEDGWEQDYRRPADGSVTVQLTDLFGVLPNIVLPGVFEGAILDTLPRGYWRLNEAQGQTGEEVSDQSEQQNPGTVLGTVTFGEHALAAGLGESALFDKGDQGDQVSRIDISRSRVGRFPYQESVLCVLRTDTDPPNQSWLDQDFIFQDVDGSNFSSNSVRSHTLSVWHTGQVRSQAAASALGADAILGRVVTDGQPHLVFGIRSAFGPSDGIGVDTPIVDDSTNTGGVQVRGSGSSIAGLANAGGSWNDNQFNGTLQHVAMWDRPLTQADRDHIYNAYAGLTGQRSDEHLRWAFNRIGVPDEFLNFDEGVVRMGAADSGGKDTLDFAREVMSTEGSALFVDHHDGGKIRFYNRYRRWLHHRSAVAQVPFSDDPAATSVVRVEEGSLRVQPRGVSTVVNIWTVTWAGGEEVARDEDSIRRYGPRGEQVDTQAPTSTYARGLARWLLSLTKEPRTLIEGFGIDPAADENGFPAAVTSQVWDRVSFRYQPLAKGSVLTRQMQIEGAHHQVENVEWLTDFFTSTAADEQQQLFLADVSETDGTDVAAP